MTVTAVMQPQHRTADQTGSWPQICSWLAHLVWDILIVPSNFKLYLISPLAASVSQGRNHHGGCLLLVRRGHQMTFYSCTKCCPVCEFQVRGQEGSVECLFSILTAGSSNRKPAARRWTGDSLQRDGTAPAAPRADRTQRSLPLFQPDQSHPAPRSEQ